MSGRKQPNLPVHETELGNKIADAVRTLVPAFEKAVWSEYKLETEDFSIMASWDDRCGNVNIRIRITP